MEDIEQRNNFEGNVNAISFGLPKDDYVGITYIFDEDEQVWFLDSYIGLAEDSYKRILNFKQGFPEGALKVVFIRVEKLQELYEKLDRNDTFDETKEVIDCLFIELAKHINLEKRLLVAEQENIVFNITTLAILNINTKRNVFINLNQKPPTNEKH